mmetsp:Transcript_6737/g.18317  ORF Transcript_6737/g.18317 Transcript_6737/m.18317 type:complete len:241 (-) Transcript_6737:327-1049(-)
MIRARGSIAPSSSSYLRPLLDAAVDGRVVAALAVAGRLPAVDFFFFGFSPSFDARRLGSLWSIPSPPGPVSNAGRWCIPADERAVLLPDDVFGLVLFTAVPGRDESFGPSSTLKPPHRVFRRTVAPELVPGPPSSSRHSRSRASRPSRVTRRPLPSYTTRGVAVDGLAVERELVFGRADGLSRGSLCPSSLLAVAGRLPSYRASSSSSSSSSSKARRFGRLVDLGVNAFRGPFGSIRRPS